MERLRLGATLWLLVEWLEALPVQMQAGGLAPAMRRLAQAIDARHIFRGRYGAPLLRGFEILAAQPAPPRKKRKLETMRAGLRLVLMDEPPAGDMDVEMLWQAVVEVARQEARRAAGPRHLEWCATVAAWDEGLATIRRAG